MSETEGNTFWDIKGSALQTTTNQVSNRVTVMTQHVTVMTQSDTVMTQSDTRDPYKTANVM